MRTEDHKSGAYPISTTRGAEIQRLLDQTTLLQLALGASLPPTISLFPGMRIVDMACGPGGWSLQCAHEHQDKDINVIGIDCNPDAIEYAQCMAKVQLRTNVSFQVDDITQPITIAANSIDLIFGRFLVGVLDKESWPVFLEECARLLKPGGVVLLTECEGVLTNCSALNQFQHYLFQAFYQDERTYSLDGHSLGIMHMLRPLLEFAGFTNLQAQVFMLDMSFGSPLQPYATRNFEMFYGLLKDYIVKRGLIDADLYDQLHRKLTAEVIAPEFLCLCYGLSMWGKKTR